MPHSCVPLANLNWSLTLITSLPLTSQYCGENSHCQGCVPIRQLFLFPPFSVLTALFEVSVNLVPLQMEFGNVSFFKRIRRIGIYDFQFIYGQTKGANVV